MLGFPVGKVVTSLTLQAWETMGGAGVCCGVALCGCGTTNEVGAEALRILEGLFQTEASLCCTRAACSDGRQLFLTLLRVRRGCATELQGRFLLTAFREWIGNLRFHPSEKKKKKKSRNTMNLMG